MPFSSYLYLQPISVVHIRALRQTLVVASLAAGMLWAQNVGIGTATPQIRLHVDGAGGVTGGIRVTSTAMIPATRIRRKKQNFPVICSYSPLRAFCAHRGDGRSTLVVSR